MYEYKATLERVIDGDTVILDVDFGFHMRGRLPFRIAGIDAPERNQEGYSASSTFLSMLLDNQQLTIRTHKGQTFARWICDIYIDSQSVAEMMVEAGHATNA